MSNKHPIGIFDSGIGGTSIWREIASLLPNESTLYLSDSINAPYGEKSPEKILEFSVKNTELLLEKGSKIIVVACNTATTNAIKILRNTFDVPFIGIEPAIKPAALQTKTKSIGILATKGTLSSALFSETLKKNTTDITVIEQVGKGLVELIESGKLYSNEMTSLLTKYLNPMLEKNIDSLVLGCTHYPYLIPQIKTIVGQKVTIIDSGLAVAKQTKSILEKFELCNTLSIVPTYKFYTNSKKSVLKNILKDVELDYTIKKRKF
ncbi:glutamate racemase [Urechidicola croceus]|uniref:Glutamate racemase n=1 Tax=Urechidicola croceus TaxID=1850246 RepID=A0A1D8P7V6_9FLAO|nr:glutamate racemase [Urechidicola croceus]AOW20644.1 glutamate racemase [Urechidicola croceus]